MNETRSKFEKRSLKKATEPLECALIALPTGCTHVTLTFFFVFGTVLNIWESDCIKSPFNNLFTAISVQVNRQKSENYRRNKP